MPLRKLGGEVNFVRKEVQVVMEEPVNDRFEHVLLGNLPRMLLNAL